jgi:Ca2+/Na+ antiporter
MPDICSSRSSRRTVFALLGLAGVAYLVISIARGRVWTGVIAAAFMLAYALVLWLARTRSETIELLGGEGGDERQRELVQRATAITGQVLICVAVAGALATFATKSELGLAFSGMAGLGGVTFAGSLAWLGRRG